MQGFNRYVPPDYDPKQHSTLNAYQGKKHALGKRAAKIDEGILTVRFELPFNIWCGTCNNHIGAGVRYNARKSKVGAYYSTPIFAFRCKCHLCDGWFEIRTDPQHARYVMHEGARQKAEEWDPAEHGGYGIFDTEAAPAGGPSGGGEGSGAEVDAFAALEKDTDQQSAVRAKKSRIDELSAASDRQGRDPYAVSRSLRARFREEKREGLVKQAADAVVRERYALDEGLELGEEAVERGAEKWAAARERRGLPVAEKGKEELGKTLRRNTKARVFDVFDAGVELVGRVRLKRKREAVGPEYEEGKKVVAKEEPETLVTPPSAAPAVLGIAGGLLAGYGSSDSDGGSDGE